MTFIENCCSRISGVPGRGIKLPLVIALISLIITGCNKQLQDMYPKEMRDVKLGISKSQVIDMTKQSGKSSEGAVPKRRDRIRLSWALDSHPNFETVTFDFTELDRLYSIRLVLKPGRDSQERSVRDFLLHKYHVSPEFPGKMRVGDDDVMMYVGLEGVTTSLLEFTNMVNGRKTYEVFDRGISATDFREYLSKKPKEQSEKKDAPAAPAASPEDQAGWGKPGTDKAQSKPANEADAPKEPASSHQEAK